MRSVFPFGGVVGLRFRGTCRQVTRLLSCGSSERRRSPDAVGPYWLGPPSLPLARMVCQARSASRFSDTRVERGVASNNAFYLTVLRRHCRVSPQRRVIGLLCRSFVWAWCMRGAEHRDRTRWQLRIRLPGRHPRVGPDVRAESRGQARKIGPRGRIARHLCSHDGTVLGLGPFVTQHLSVRGDGRASSIELRHLAGKPAGWRVLRERVAVRTAARGRSPPGLSATGA
jgi:hypothetical protein